MQASRPGDRWQDIEACSGSRKFLLEYANRENNAGAHKSTSPRVRPGMSEAHVLHSARLTRAIRVPVSRRRQILFNRLIASSRDKHRAWNSGTVVLSVAAHLLVLAVILVLTRPSDEVAPPPPKPEEVTYVDVTEIPPPPEPEVAPEPEPEPEQPTPQPTPPRAAPRQPRNPPPVQKPTEVAGTQELKTPPVV